MGLREKVPTKGAHASFIPFRNEWNKKRWKNNFLDFPPIFSSLSAEG